ncbi:MAG: ABC-2 family transporter protein [Thermomicrobiales bacterium]|nr:ABC-2 family transporter protein [Thermomicrobiales bacterium]
MNEGKLDLLLIRPVNVQFLVTFRYVSLFRYRECDYWVDRLRYRDIPGQHCARWQAILQTIIIFICDLTLLTSLWYRQVSTSPFALTTVNDQLGGSDIAQMGQYPISFYPAAIRFVLTAIVPVAFVTTVPMDALRGFTGWDTVLLTVAFTALVLKLLGWWWSNSVRHYASASS